MINKDEGDKGDEKLKLRRGVFFDEWHPSAKKNNREEREGPLGVKEIDWETANVSGGNNLEGAYSI